MTWLKKIGTILAAGFGVVKIFAPAIAAAVPVAVPVVGEIAQVGQVIVDIEAGFAAAFGADAKKGSDKLRAATPLVAQIIHASQLMAHKKVKNEAAFTKACEGITSNFADLLNSIGE